MPFAAEFAEPSRRGATIGTVMSGLLCGILFGRTGWAAVCGFGAALVAIALGLRAWGRAAGNDPIGREAAIARRH